MYIGNNGYSQIINSEFVERFVCVQKSDAVLIVASYNDVRPPVTMGRYRDMKEAQDALGELLNALAGGQTVFHMPESLLHGEQTAIRDARTKRKGGS